MRPYIPCDAKQEAFVTIFLIFFKKYLEVPQKENAAYCVSNSGVKQAY
jgi:hypothetical protein